MDKDILEYATNSLNSINFFNWKIKISKNTKNSENICSFDGYINILFDDAGIIYDWKWELVDVSVDLFTTKSWENEQKWFKRLKMFKSIDSSFELKVRENKFDHKIKNLNNFQIDNLNNYLNSQSNTIKNIITLLKGSNPSGERKNPSASEIRALIDGKEINFALFFKENCYFKVNNDLDLKQYWIDSIEKNYFNLLKTISLREEFKFKGITKNNLYDLLLITSDKNFKQYYEKWQNNLKQNLKENIKLIKGIDEGIKKARSKYYREITEHYDIYKVWDIPKEEIQRAHIISAKYARYKIIETLFKNFKIYIQVKREYLNKISDPYNFLNLPNSIHQKFDKDKFNYDYKSGEIDASGDKILNTNESLLNINMYKHIPKDKLNSKRADYLKKRAQILNTDQKSAL